MIQLDLPVTTSFHDFNEIRSNSNIFRLTNESYPSRVRCLTIGDEFSRELCCGTHVRSTKEIEDFLLVRVDSKGQSNKRIYCLTGSFAENVQKSFSNDFLRRFERLENERERIPIDELFSECQNLRETFLDERSLNFPQNQRENFYSRWQNLMPDKKLLRKFLLAQLNDDPTRLFIRSNVDLPIYEIGFMLLRYDDSTGQRQNQSAVFYVNFHQNFVVVYLKNPRQRDEFVRLLTKRLQMNFVENFHAFDDQTRQLFSKTKKLLVFKDENVEHFHQLDFSTIFTEIFFVEILDRREKKRFVSFYLGNFMETGETMVEIIRSTTTTNTNVGNIAAATSNETHEGVKQYYIQKIEELQVRRIQRTE